MATLTIQTTISHDRSLLQLTLPTTPLAHAYQHLLPSHKSYPYHIAIHGETLYFTLPSSVVDFHANTGATFQIDFDNDRDAALWGDVLWGVRGHTAYLRHVWGEEELYSTLGVRVPKPHNGNGIDPGTKGKHKPRKPAITYSPGSGSDTDSDMSVDLHLQLHPHHHHHHPHKPTTPPREPQPIVWQHVPAPPLHRYHVHHHEYWWGWPSSYHYHNRERHWHHHGVGSGAGNIVVINNH